MVGDGIKWVMQQPHPHRANAGLMHCLLNLLGCKARDDHDLFHASSPKGKQLPFQNGNSRQVDQAFGSTPGEGQEPGALSSEERGVGNGWVITRRSRWLQYY